MKIYVGSGAAGDVRHMAENKQLTQIVRGINIIMGLLSAVITIAEANIALMPLVQSAISGILLLMMIVYLPIISVRWR